MQRCISQGIEKMMNVRHVRATRPIGLAPVSKGPAPILPLAAERTGVNPVKRVLPGGRFDREQMRRNVRATGRIQPLHLESQHDPGARKPSDRHRPAEDDKILRLFGIPFGYLEAHRAEVRDEILAVHFRKQGSGPEKR